MGQAFPIWSEEIDETESEGEEADHERGAHNGALVLVLPRAAAQRAHGTRALGASPRPLRRATFDPATARRHEHAGGRADAHGEDGLGAERFEHVPLGHFEREPDGVDRTPAERLQLRCVLRALL